MLIFVRVLALFSVWSLASSSFPDYLDETSQICTGPNAAIAPDKLGYSYEYFSYFIMKTYVVGTH